MGDTFTWRVAASGPWSAAANWTDTTTSANPALMPPGVADSATITGPANQATYFAVSGPGNVSARRSRPRGGVWRHADARLSHRLHVNLRGCLARHPHQQQQQQRGQRGHDQQHVIVDISHDLRLLID